MINQESQAKITEFLVWALFYVLPLLAVGLFFCFVDFPYWLNFKDRDVEAGLSSAWIGYSFAAAFFLIALPRNKYLLKLESKKLLLKYFFVVVSPALIGTAHMLSIVITRDDGTELPLKISAFLFYSTLSYAMYSLVLLVAIAINSSRSSK